MPSFFVESSALVKRFAPESGSSFVLNLLRPSAKNRFYVARITEVEVCAALVRRRKGQSLSASQSSKAMRRLRREFPIRFTHIAINEDVIIGALRLTETYGLRGYDAVQLSAALKANSERVSRGLLPLILVSSDDELNSAAKSEGLTVENPNNYP
jgi:predicted nucleic acid-binding protein